MLQNKEVAVIGARGNVTRLLGGTSRRRNALPTLTLEKPAAASNPPIRPVKILHDPRSGRLHAGRIAEFFPFSQTEMAEMLGVTPAYLRHFPAATLLQAKLSVFERVAAALLFLAGSEENARLWLSLPDAQLGDKTPLALIKAGRGHIVAEMLEDMIWGQPS